MLYRLPPRFVEDMVDRELLPESVIVRQTKSYAIVDLDEAQLSEVRKDAEFYVSEASYFVDDPYVRGLVASARATLRALAKAEA